MGLLKSIFGDYSSRELKSIYPTVDKIEAMADELIAGADNCYMSREAVFDSFRAHWTIKKMLEYYIKGPLLLLMLTIEEVIGYQGNIIILETYKY